MLGSLPHHYSFTPTFYAQQGAAAGLQIKQHLLTKGVVRLDLRRAGRHAGRQAQRMLEGQAGIQAAGSAGQVGAEQAGAESRQTAGTPGSLSFQHQQEEPCLHCKQPPTHLLINNKCGSLQVVSQPAHHFATAGEGRAEAGKQGG